MDALSGEPWVVDDDVHGQLTPDVSISVRWVRIKHEGRLTVLVGLCTTVGELGLVLVVEVNHDVDVRQTRPRVLGDDGNGAAHLFLLVLDHIEKVNGDDGINLDEDRLTDACSVEVECIVSGDVKEEVLRANLKPVRCSGGEREVSVGPENGTLRETACTIPTVLTVGTVANREDEVLEDLTGTTDFTNRSRVGNRLEDVVGPRHHVGVG